MISKWSLVNTEQEITIRNTRKSAIVLTVKEQIPRSVEDKIKVRVCFSVALLPYLSVSLFLSSSTFRSVSFILSTTWPWTRNQPM